jgi:diaminohydroxyphosphoribosylaminopyrimidine deaminase/5-amino-6-(5-phosphoribosylamino)uracil reductase
VVEGVRAEGCAALNPPYLKFLATGLPWVLLKAMVSLDGRVATDAGDSRGLGGPEQQRLSHGLRSSHDAVLAGIGTVLEDDPELTVRLRRGRNPARVVLDSNLRIPLESRVVATAEDVPLIVATTRSDGDVIRTLEARGARVWTFPPAPDGRVPLPALLRKLAAEGMLAVLVEGGPTVHTAFLRERLADRVAIGVAPVLVGGATAPAWTRDLGLPRLEEALELTDVTTRRVGRDLWIEGSLRGADHV